MSVRSPGRPLGSVEPVGPPVHIERPLYNDPGPFWEKKTERVRDRVVCDMAIAGATQREIAASVGIASVTAGNVLRQPWARQYMIEKISRTAQEEIRALLEAAAPQAIARVIEVAKAPETKLGFAANIEILDRFLGRSVQPIATEPKDFDKLSDAELEAIAAGAVASPPRADVSRSDAEGSVKGNGHADAPMPPVDRYV